MHPQTVCTRLCFLLPRLKSSGGSLRARLGIPTSTFSRRGSYNAGKMLPPLHQLAGVHLKVFISGIADMSQVIRKGQESLANSREKMYQALSRLTILQATGSWARAWERGYSWAADTAYFGIFACVTRPFSQFFWQGLETRLHQATWSHILRWSQCRSLIFCTLQWLGMPAWYPFRLDPWQLSLKYSNFSH